MHTNENGQKGWRTRTIRKNIIIASICSLSFIALVLGGAVLSGTIRLSAPVAASQPVLSQAVLSGNLPTPAVTVTATEQTTQQFSVLLQSTQPSPTHTPLPTSAAITSKPTKTPMPTLTPTPKLTPTITPTPVPTPKATLRLAAKVAPAATHTATPKPKSTSRTTKPAATTATATSSRSKESMMIDLVNQERGKAGLKALVYDSNLRTGALAHSKDMSANNYFDHVSPTAGNFQQRINDSGVKYTSAGENIAMYDTVEKAHEGLMNSPGHRANILNTGFTRVGIGIIYNQSRGYYYITQWFAK